MKNVIACLQERGFIDAMTSEEIIRLVEKPVSVYVGFDPTASSLHLGNLVGMVALGWFQRFGHQPVVILGGATGCIGDPSGKSVERPLLDLQTIEANVRSIAKQFEKILDFNHPTAKPLVLNNNDWLGSYQLIDFLRDVGKHFRVGVMLGKESVRARLASDEGMSYTEFSYQLLQAYDFHYLLNHHNVSFQMGGSDQWGNIVAGIELIRKLCGKSGYGITFPLITRSDGKKFGKTEEGAIWLSPDKVSPYQFYQYLVRMPDSDVIMLMRMLTYMEMSEIRQYEAMMKGPDYVPNTAQKKLAEEVTKLVHGQEGLEQALKVTEGLTPGSNTELDPKTFHEIIADMPHVNMKKEEIVGHKLVDLIVRIGLTSSKGETVRLIQNGGVYLNNQKVEDSQGIVGEQHLIGGNYLLFGIGKKKKMMVKVENNLFENQSDTTMGSST